MKTIAVDWDGTLVEYHGWVGPTDFGPPIPLMVERVKGWIAEGHEVIIFTSRVSKEHDQDQAIGSTFAILGMLNRMGIPPLTITANKYIRVSEFWDDRAVRVELNTGSIYNGFQDT